MLHLSTSTWLPHSLVSHTSIAENTVSPNVFFVASIICKRILGFVLGLWSSQSKLVVLFTVFTFCLFQVLFESSS
jgi:hypothetical protein